MSVKLVFSFPVNATFEEVSEAVALHFGGEPVNLSTGEVVHTHAEPRDASAVFTGIATSAPTPLDLDAEGLPWDERIHSGTRAKNEDGTWKLRRGAANSANLQTIKAELKAKVSGGAAPASANLHDKSDDATRARLDYAHEQAVIAVGPVQHLTNDQFLALKRGQTGIEVPQAGIDWFNRYQQAFNAAYAAYAEATLAATEGTVHMSAQAINPAAAAGIVQIAGTPAPVTVAPAGPGAAPAPVTVAPAGPGAAPAPITTFAEFAVKYATVPAATLDEVMAPLGLSGGLAGLAPNPAMIPAVVAMLVAKGIA